jgi:hypothetical protein
MFIGCCSARETVVELPWAADSRPCVVEAANRATSTCWYQRPCGAVGALLKWRRPPTCTACVARRSTRAAARRISTPGPSACTSSAGERRRSISMDSATVETASRMGPVSVGSSSLISSPPTAYPWLASPGAAPPPHLTPHPCLVSDSVRGGSEARSTGSFRSAWI